MIAQQLSVQSSGKQKSLTMNPIQRQTMTTHRKTNASVFSLKFMLCFPLCPGLAGQDMSTAQKNCNLLA